MTLFLWFYIFHIMATHTIHQMLLSLLLKATNSKPKKCSLAMLWCIDCTPIQILVISHIFLVTLHVKKMLFIVSSCVWHITHLLWCGWIPLKAKLSYVANLLCKILHAHNWVVGKTFIFQNWSYITLPRSSIINIRLYISCNYLDSSTTRIMRLEYSFINSSHPFLTSTSICL